MHISKFWRVEFQEKKCKLSKNSSFIRFQVVLINLWIWQNGYLSYKKEGCTRSRGAYYRKPIASTEIAYIWGSWCHNMTVLSIANENSHQFLSAFSRVYGLNNSWSHCDPCLLLVYSFILKSSCQSLWILAAIHWWICFSSLNIMKGERKLPLVQIYSNAIIHFWWPGFAWNYWRMMALMICYEASTSLIARPLSSML